MEEIIAPFIKKESSKIKKNPVNYINNDQYKSIDSTPQKPIQEIWDSDLKITKLYHGTASVNADSILKK